MITVAGAASALQSLNEIAHRLPVTSYIARENVQGCRLKVNESV